MCASKRLKANSLTFNLNYVGIDEAAVWLEENLTQIGTERPDRTRVRLLTEEALLNMARHFGDEREAILYLEGHFGFPLLRLVVEGTSFNPLGAEEDEWSTKLFSSLGIHAFYSYAMERNVLRIPVPRHSMNLVLKMGIAILVGALFGVLGNVFIPDTTLLISDAVLKPVSDMWFRLLQAISGPVIFLTALVGTISMKRVADYGGSRFLTLAHYFFVGTLAIVLAMFCSLPFFPLDIGATQPTWDSFSQMLDRVLKIVPGNFFEPFNSANTLQLLLIAFVTGSILAALESQVSELNALIHQLNTLGLTVAQQASRLVPFFAGLLLCLKIWTHDTDRLGAIWEPLVLSAILSIIVLIVSILVTSFHQRVSPLLLARKLKDPFMVVLKRGSLNFASVDNLARSCKQLLGINEGFAHATLPQGLFIYMPTSGIGIFVFLLFAAQTQHLEVDQAWVFIAAVLSIVLAMATPPLTGANLLSFMMAFTFLGIPEGAMLDVMVFDILFGVLCVPIDQAMLQLETIRRASMTGFLDVDVLRAPLEPAE